MIRIVLKNLITRRTRTALTMIGIIIGVAMIVGLVSISEGLQRETTDALGLLQVVTVLEEGTMSEIFSNVPLEYVDEIERIQGVNIASPEIYTRISSIEGETLQGFESFTSMVMGLDPVSHA